MLKNKNVSDSRVLLCLVCGAEGYGVRAVWSQVFEGFRLRGWTVVVAVLDARQAGSWRAAYSGVSVVSSNRYAAPFGVAAGRWAKVFSMFRRAVEQLGHASWLSNLANEIGATTLMIQSPPESFLAGIVSRKLGLRALWLVPNIIGSNVPFDLNRWVYRLVFRLGKVVPISNSRFTDCSFGLGDFLRHVVHLGVDPERYRPGGNRQKVRTTLGISDHATVIGLFARLVPDKSQDRLIHALAESGTPFHLILCGWSNNDNYIESLRNLTERLHLKDRIHLVGQQMDLRPYYAACDIIASIGLIPKGFGLTIIEAMASGKPVIAHKLGGPSEIIVNGEAGWLLEDVENKTLALGLSNALQAQEEWAPIGLKGRERVLKYFQENAFINNIEDIALANKFIQKRYD